MSAIDKAYLQGKSGIYSVPLTPPFLCVGPSTSNFMFSDDGKVLFIYANGVCMVYKRDGDQFVRIFQVEI